MPVMCSLRHQGKWAAVECRRASGTLAGHQSIRNQNLTSKYCMRFDVTHTLKEQNVESMQPCMNGSIVGCKGKGSGYYTLIVRQQAFRFQ